MASSERKIPAPAETTLADFLKRPPEYAGVFIGYEGRLWVGVYDSRYTLAIVGGMALDGLSETGVREALNTAHIEPKLLVGWAWDWMY